MGRAGKVKICFTTDSENRVPLLSGTFYRTKKDFFVVKVWPHKEFDGKLNKFHFFFKLTIHIKECPEVSKRIWNLKICMNVEQGVI